MDLRLQSDLSVSIQQSHMVDADCIAKYQPDRKACKVMQCVSAPKIAGFCCQISRTLRQTRIHGPYFFNILSMPNLRKNVFFLLFVTYSIY